MNHWLDQQTNYCPAWYYVVQPNNLYLSASAYIYLQAPSHSGLDSTSINQRLRSSTNTNRYINYPAVPSTRTGGLDKPQRS